MIYKNKSNAYTPNTYHHFFYAVPDTGAVAKSCCKKRQLLFAIGATAVEILRHLTCGIL
jgi:hypothetical protein